MQGRAMPSVWLSIYPLPTSPTEANETGRFANDIVLQRWSGSTWFDYQVLPACGSPWDFPVPKREGEGMWNEFSSFGMGHMSIRAFTPAYVSGFV